MRILLDTNIFLWCIIDDAKLTKKAKDLIVEADERYVSSASIWEIAIKKSIGKLDSNNDIGSLADVIEESGFIELPVTAKHAATIFHLEHIHRDPFDRLLIAQAICEPLIFVTADMQLEKYSELVKVISLKK
ncbi:MAG: type II toxin-antitoxin system VapC family toxin [Verrucomicrobia bacterium]|nr:type II toxin-antitoxin system VapC family toxin [Verrucomicrobiota bacterium]